MKVTVLITCEVAPIEEDVVDIIEDSIWHAVSEIENLLLNRGSSLASPTVVTTKEGQDV